VSSAVFDFVHSSKRMTQLNKAEAEALRTLKLRNGGPLEPEVESAFASRSDEAISRLSKHETSWPVRAAALVFAREGLKESRLKYETCSEACLDNIEHEEVRTRLETIGLLEELCAKDKDTTWKSFGHALFDVAKKNIDLDLEARGEEAERKGMRETKQDAEDREVILDPRLPIELEVTKTQRYSAVNFSDYRGRVRANSSGASARIRLDSGAVVLMVHETVGWKALETSLKGLDRLVRGFGPDFVSKGYLTKELIDLFDQVLAHENRFVREVGYQLVETLARVTFVKGGDKEDSVGFREQVRVELYHSAAEGMCDKCAQVRFAALLAAKALLETRNSAWKEEALLVESVLAPVLCMNRHYSAEGLRVVAQDVWRATFPTDGPKVIARHSEGFINVYLAEMKTSKDDGAREAACYAVGELASKVAGIDDVVSSYAEEILDCLIARFHDASWSVRAAACNSSALLVQRFAQLLKDAATKGLVDGLVECLSDPVWSVRDEAAIALGVLGQLYSDVLLPTLMKTAQEWMSKARLHDETHFKECNHHHHHSKTETSTHENLMMFSCCSAEANIDFSQLKRSDWQYSDGGVRLLRELAVRFPAQIEPSPVMTEYEKVIEALRYHTASGSSLEETTWASVEPVAKAFGKRPFKRHLDPMITPMIEAIKGRRHKAAHAAATTCQFLREWVGEGVFRARLESCDPSYWQIAEANPPQSFEGGAVSFRV